MASSQQTALSGLARALVQHGRLQEANAAACSAPTENPAGFVGEVVQRGLLRPLDIASFCASTFGSPWLDLDAFDDGFFSKDAIDAKLMAKHQVLALGKRGNRLAVALADPTNLRALDEIRFQTGSAVDPVVVEVDKLGRLLGKITESASSALSNLSGADDFDLEGLNDMPAEESADPQASSDVDDAPVVRFIQKMLVDAIGEGASDIHFEPYEKYYRIRFRTDGILREIAQPPLALKEKIAARIKVISRLDISEKRVPQDGRMKLVLSKNKSIDFRVSTLPTLHGEKIVMRILDPSSAMMGIDALGYEPDQRAALLDAIERPYGMVLVTGPTGSGKTVSLYTCLNILNKPGVNISTAEDPAEINLPGINQVTMNDKAGLTFAVSLKAFLRQDPDIIMVGEIRDLETAEISIKAAQTGHMVMSTLHTNDAPTTLERLRNMGVAPFNIASSVIMITAQRLARRLCSCKKPLDIPVEALLQAGFNEADLDGSWQAYGPVGCDRCKGSGYKGRVGIYQVMPVSEEMQRIIMTGGNSMDIAAQAQLEGIRDLRQSGLLKVKQGQTSLTEVLATTNE
ncbi:MAG: type IV-A pilus assembly ATPase PilB [Candidatus Dactylopiibacterium carminicum]|uniref:Type IV-A pilus assembly ATPase PilB n=1 Tax=Candidatus Dactylopiibacterium carminicum TaxID=857335 RepID=A0A272ETD1_9RHOO|nr:type IV-A pilus assembly ATPase PilB [Candidatus Dactylopiibacterium carminicum]KAF7599342.1 type IV-A pilus assembly ATPase PilB [Candidatus Dactylopiibacterium carminicum]PAS93352.1 MAG: type IV-A pilus assembly ATPase PilB [Candidatus Dactylopiibacterium carminicum]PAS98306.1 MAG: type IV-A pilus assembly ATPase PilB [Candidatus Dactylopiibacterium carminicum]PAS99349.1 MAG: type IV-A pilus assembly ATPase PilB [Candidatus Dactylopiibacterium carminicum]